MKVWTKICGINRVEDAVVACDAGADAIGVNFCAGSVRRCDLRDAREIVRAVGDAIEIYAVVADGSPDAIGRLVRELRLSGVQLHGQQDEDVVEEVRDLLTPAVKLIRAVAVTSRTAAHAALEHASGYRVLLDSPRGGGSGLPFDSDFVAGLDLSRAIAAGGLTPHNVAEVVARLRPYGVDVASGVESSPGIKDHARIREFINHAKRSAA